MSTGFGNDRVLTQDLNMLCLLILVLFVQTPSKIRTVRDVLRVSVMQKSTSTSSYVAQKSRIATSWLALEPRERDSVLSPKFVLLKRQIRQIAILQNHL